MLHGGLDSPMADSVLTSVASAVEDLGAFCKSLRACVDIDGLRADAPSEILRSSQRPCAVSQASQAPPQVFHVNIRAGETATSSLLSLGRSAERLAGVEAGEVSRRIEEGVDRLLKAQESKAIDIVDPIGSAATGIDTPGLIEKLKKECSDLEAAIDTARSCAHIPTHARGSRLAQLKSLEAEASSLRRRFGDYESLAPDVEACPAGSGNLRQSDGTCEEQSARGNGGLSAELSHWQKIVSGLDGLSRSQSASVLRVLLRADRACVEQQRRDGVGERRWAATTEELRSLTEKCRAARTLAQKARIRGRRVAAAVGEQRRLYWTELEALVKLGRSSDRGVAAGCVRQKLEDLSKELIDLHVCVDDQDELLATLEAKVRHAEARLSCLDFHAGQKEIGDCSVLDTKVVASRNPLDETEVDEMIRLECENEELQWRLFQAEEKVRAAEAEMSSKVLRSADVASTAAVTRVPAVAAESQDGRVSLSSQASLPSLKGHARGAPQTSSQDLHALRSQLNSTADAASEGNVADAHEKMDEEQAAFDQAIASGTDKGSAESKEERDDDEDHLSKEGSALPAEEGGGCAMREDEQERCSPHDKRLVDLQHRLSLSRDERRELERRQRGQGGGRSRSSSLRRQPVENRPCSVQVANDVPRAFEANARDTFLPKANPPLPFLKTDFSSDLQPPCHQESTLRPVVQDVPRFASDAASAWPTAFESNAGLPSFVPSDDILCGLDAGVAAATLSAGAFHGEGNLFPQNVSGDGLVHHQGFVGEMWQNPINGPTLAQADEPVAIASTWVTAQREACLDPSFHASDVGPARCVTLAFDDDED
eukprot:TRINITY_DN49993_c0_g1_i1.p1 TRINITY_DN49993_c0_g1~~TRINITY_DN49993_c0_g1_i1.p1  ORF type:complete len:826 (-),score=152.07 TRINITY_DN49993_c0_g1_i1:121-2598(-)